MSAERLRTLRGIRAGRATSERADAAAARDRAAERVNQAEAALRAAEAEAEEIARAGLTGAGPRSPMALEGAREDIDRAVGRIVERRAELEQARVALARAEEVLEAASRGLAAAKRSEDAAGRLAERFAADERRAVRRREDRAAEADAADGRRP